MNPESGKLAIARAYEKVDWKAVPCWEFPACLNAYGYAVLRRREISDQPAFLHRLLYEMLVGEIPEGKELDHLCRNPKCVCPFHLEPVSHAVNIRRGVIHTKLDWESVQRIRNLAKEGIAPSAIAKESPVSLQQVLNIIDGKCWKQNYREEGIGKWQARN